MTELRGSGVAALPQNRASVCVVNIVNDASQFGMNAIVDTTWTDVTPR